MLNTCGFLQQTETLGLGAGQGEDVTNTTLFIGALSSSVTEEELKGHFARYGPVVYCKVPSGGSAPKNCAFVQFVNRSSAEHAMQEMHGQVCAFSAYPAMHACGREGLRADPADSVADLAPAHGDEWRFSRQDKEAVLCSQATRLGPLSVHQKFFSVMDPPPWLLSSALSIPPTDRPRYPMHIMRANGTTSSQAAPSQSETIG